MNTHPCSKPRLLLLLSLLLLAATGTALAQAPGILWQRCYGGDSTDQVNCIKQTSDGGYIATGLTRSVNGDLATNGGIKGLWVLKLDPLGNIQWEKTYSDTLTEGDYIEPTTDGGYILTGNKTIKLHSDGSIDWINNIQGSKIHQTSDGGYILCNYYYLEPSLVKFNADGSIAWQNTDMSSMGDPLTIYDACESATGGYIITGTIYDIYSSFFVAKTDNLGNMIIPPVDNYSHSAGLSICKTTDDNYIVSGFDEMESVITKINDNCATDWNENITYIEYVSFASVAPANDYGVIACGSNLSDIIAEVYDSAGNLQWEKTMGGSQADIAGYGFQAASGNYVVGGYTSSNDGDVSGNHGGEDGWVVEFGTNVSVPGITNAQGEIKTYPVPAMERVYIDLPKGYEHATLKLVDVSGKAVAAKEDNNGLSHIFYLDGLAAGEYLLQVTDNGVYNSKKIVHY